MRYAHITGWGKYLPPTVLTNHDLAEIVDTSDEWIVEHTGIRERRIAAVGDTTASMATAAAQQALERAGLAATDLDLIIVSTSSPDRQLPGAAPIVQSMLGAEQAPAFDLRSGCSGFVFGLSVARQYILSGSYRRVLVVGSEIVSRFLNWSDRRTCVLFGDGAGAALLEPAGEDEVGLMDFVLRTDGSGGKFLYMPGGGSLNPPSHETVDKKMHVIHQEGRQVFKFAVTEMANVSEEILRRNNLTPQQVKLFVPHQANLRIISALAERLNLSDDQVIVNIERYGNTTSATIPICLYEAARDGRIRKGDWVVLASFGAGFTWGSTLLRWEI